VTENLPASAASVGEPPITELAAQMAYANEGRRLCGLGLHAWMPWLAIWVGDPLYISRYETYCVRCRRPEQFDV
jgi:hypothetical protein